MTTLHRLATFMVIAGGFALAGQALAQTQDKPLPTDTIVRGGGGSSTAYFVGHSADDVDTVSLANASSSQFVNQTSAIGTSVALGTFSSGAEIEFSLTDFTIANTFYTGPGFRNPDGEVHANVTTNIGDITGLSAASYAYASTLPAGTTFVGFEDRLGAQSDFDYNDLVFAVENSTPGNVPEPASLALLGGSVIGFGLIRRRRASSPT